jgi:predicted phage replisome organizer
VANITWIKINTGLFEDEKIRLIEKMPEADTVIMMWVRLICMAGKINDGGAVYLSEGIPYSAEDFAAIFNRPIATVRLALGIFERYRMIEVLDDGTLYLVNWEKHQSIQIDERKREQTRLRVARFRERHKMLPEAVTRYVTQSNEEDKEEDKEEEDKEKKKKRKFSENEDGETEVTWGQVKEWLRGNISTLNFTTWVEPLSLFRENGTAFVICPTNTHVEHLSQYKLSLFEQAFSEITGEKIEVVFTTK